MISSSFLDLAVAIAISYLIGSIYPTAILSIFRGLNLEELKSGRYGTKKLLEALGPKAALVILIVDIAKGYDAVLIGRIVGAEFYCAVAVLLGDVFSIFHRFHGPQGAATALGAALAVNPLLGAICAVVAGLTYLYSKYISLASIVAAAAFPIIAFFIKKEFVPYAAIMALVVILKHKDNIKLLKEGKEVKIEDF